ncbi:MAG: hypothetical protein WC847_02815 [Candidatus Paceibacterota bacterium]
MSEIKQLLRKGIRSSGPYTDLYTVREEPEPFLSFKNDVLKINFKPIEEFLGEVFNLSRARTWAFIFVAIVVFVLWGIHKVDSNLQRAKAEHRALQAIGLAE